jgi:hypothetical protein
MQEAYFEKIRSQIIPLLKEASKEVLVAMAWFTSNELFSELLNCLKRGVRVELVLLDSPINFMEYAPDFNEFINAGGHLHIASSELGLMHNKFCVIDNKMVITGSYNWTYYAETRNKENILVTDNKKVSNQFIQEFNKLIVDIHDVKKAPRLTMSELETIENINYLELNLEIESLCRSRHVPSAKAFDTKTQVVIKETKYVPVSRFHIGLLVDNNVEVRFISAGTKLPSSEENKTFYFDSIAETDCPCKIVKISPSNISECKLIKEEDLLRVALGTHQHDLPINLSMRLDDNGSLRIDVSCEESGQKMTISVLDKSLVTYE